MSNYKLNGMNFDDPEIAEALQRAFVVIKGWPQLQPTQDYYIELTPEQYGKLVPFLRRLGLTIQKI